MFALGNVFIGQYKIWITTPVFTVHPWDATAVGLPYFQVKIERLINNNYFYVDISSDTVFAQILSLDNNKRATDKTDPIEFAFYTESRNAALPLWKLSKANVEKLLGTCQGIE